MEEKLYLKKYMKEMNKRVNKTKELISNQENFHFDTNIFAFTLDFIIPI